MTAKSEENNESHGPRVAWLSGNTGHTYVRIDKAGQAGYLTAV